MTKKYKTAIFECEEDSEFSKAITDALKSETGMDAKVTAVSLEEEITRVELLEDLAAKEGIHDEFYWPPDSDKLRTITRVCRSARLGVHFSK